MRERREELCAADKCHAAIGDVILLLFPTAVSMAGRQRSSLLSAAAAYTNTHPLSIRAQGPQSKKELDTKGTVQLLSSISLPASDLTYCRHYSDG